MNPDVNRLIGFYKSPLGKIARALVREEVIRLAGSTDKRRVLGLGFASPYLRFSLEKAERVLVFMPARQGASAWPREGPSHTVLCDPLEMPLTDAAVDLIVAVHTFEHVADAEELMRELWRIAAPKTHPLVWTHRSGRKSLVLGSTASHIEGMGRAEGRALLDELLDWATQPQFVYRHEWRLGDMLMWDNTGTMHRAEPYAQDSGRLMHRTTLLGEEAFA